MTVRQFVDARDLADWLGREPRSVRLRIEAMERLLEGLWAIPGTRQKFGLDVLLDLLPVGGPIISTAMGAWLAWEARNLRLPRRVYARMAANIAFDSVLSVIPGVGAIPDFFFRSNSRNVRLIRKWLDTNHPGTVTLTVSLATSAPVSSAPFASERAGPEL